jgi:hypothetical protein
MTTGDLVHELVATAVAVVVWVIAVAVTAILVHFTWLAKERLLVWLAARMGVPYETRQPWWIRWINR